MANFVNITLAGGLKARPFIKVPSRAPHPVSPAFLAFERLCEALADACAAEELRLDPTSWDLAIADPDRAAEDAVNAAVEAAREAGVAPLVLASDRALVFAARFINCALGIENGADRDNVMHFLDNSQELWGSTRAGAIAQQGNMHIARAIDRLSRLTDLLNGPSESDTILTAF